MACFIKFCLCFPFLFCFEVILNLPKKLQEYHMEFLFIPHFVCLMLITSIALVPLSKWGINIYMMLLSNLQTISEFLHLPCWYLFSAVGLSPESHVALSCCEASDASNQGQCLSLSLSFMNLTFWKLLASYIVECPSFRACQMFSHN